MENTIIQFLRQLKFQDEKKAYESIEKIFESLYSFKVGFTL